MLSRMYLRQLVRDGKVQVNGDFADLGRKLRAGDFVEVEADLSRGTAMRAEDIPLDIVFEDRWLLVVNKPAGMLVHPTHRDKHGTLLNGLAHYLNSKLDGGADRIRPGLVHRLDKETSGLMVVARTIDAHRRLSESFLKRRVEKRYAALVAGVVGADEGVIDLPIGRFAERKFWDVKEDGKPSVTRFRVIERFDASTLVELEPVTGRTNQLRIHCAASGHPIVGDVQRGGRAFPRLCLHAHRLVIPHPQTRNNITFETAVPADFFDRGE